MTPVPVPPGGFRPTSALVAVAWIGQRVAGVTAGQVATKLPRDLSTWADLGFVQVTILPRAADVDGLRRLPVAQVDAWAHSPEGVKPPVPKAAGLAELVYAATGNAQLFGKPVAMPASYAGALALSAYPLTEPAEVPDDPAGFARVTFDMALDWAPL